MILQFPDVLPFLCRWLLFAADDWRKEKAATRLDGAASGFESAIVLNSYRHYITGYV